MAWHGTSNWNVTDLPDEAKFDDEVKENMAYLHGLLSTVAKTDRTGARALSTVYQNLTAGPLLVVATVTGNDGLYKVWCDAADGATTEVGRSYTCEGVGGQWCVTFVVPKDYFYQIQQVGGTGVPAISKWWEIELYPAS